jgi:hypothetical protein
LDLVGLGCGGLLLLLLLLLLLPLPLFWKTSTIEANCCAPASKQHVRILRSHFFFSW